MGLRVRWRSSVGLGFAERPTRRLCEVAIELAHAAAGEHGGVRPFVVWWEDGVVRCEVPGATTDGRVYEAAFAIAARHRQQPVVGVVDAVVLRPDVGAEREAVRVVLLAAGARLGVAYATRPIPGEVHVWIERSSSAGIG